MEPLGVGTSGGSAAEALHSEASGGNSEGSGRGAASHGGITDDATDGDAS